jgi:two-component system chemotaxis response regulator CheY
MARIMIVDDSPLLRRALRRILVEHGHDIVCEAGDGAAAVREYDSHQPDLVTMDIVMPGVNGMDAAKVIKGAAPNARIVMVTSINSNESVLAAAELGAISYITKPFESAKVLAAIEQALSATGPSRPLPSAS